MGSDDSSTPGHTMRKERGGSEASRSGGWPRENSAGLAWSQRGANSLIHPLTLIFRWRCRLRPSWLPVLEAVLSGRAEKGLVLQGGMDTTCVRRGSYHKGVGSQRAGLKLEAWVYVSGNMWP